MSFIGTWYDCAHAGGIDRPWNDFSSIEVMSPCPTNKPLQFECEARGKRYTSPTIPPMNLLSTECKDFAGGSLWQSAATDKEHVLDIDESNPSCSQPSLSGGDLYLHFTQDFYCAGDRASFGNLLWSFAIHYLAGNLFKFLFI